VAETQTNGLEVWKRGNGLIRWTMCCQRAARTGRLLQQLSLHARREAGVNLPFTATTPIKTRFRTQQHPFPAVRRWSVA